MISRWGLVGFWPRSECGTRFESQIPDPCDLSQAVFCIKCLNFVLKGKLHPVHFVMSSTKAVFGRF